MNISHCKRLLAKYESKTIMGWSECVRNNVNEAINNRDDYEQYNFLEVYYDKTQDTYFAKCVKYGTRCITNCPERFC